MKSLTMLTALLGMFGLMLAGCSTEPSTATGKQELTNDSSAALADFQTTDPSLNQMLSNAYGYAIFPSVGKGAAGVGGAFGRGEVYQGGKQIGYADMTQATIGASLGAQSFSELIVFQTPAALDNFKGGAVTGDAQASAVLLKSGVAASAPYRSGVAIFIQTKGGLIGDASIGGQTFNYQPL
jgi:lipid-binding SYLF domain-containing protein